MGVFPDVIRMDEQRARLSGLPLESRATTPLCVSSEAMILRALGLPILSPVFCVLLWFISACYSHGFGGSGDRPYPGVAQSSRLSPTPGLQSAAIADGVWKGWSNHRRRRGSSRLMGDTPLVRRQLHVESGLASVLGRCTSGGVRSLGAHNNLDRSSSL